MEEAKAPGWKEHAKKAGKVTGGLTVSGALILLATQGVELVSKFVDNVGSQARAVEVASGKFARAIERVRKDSLDEIRRLEAREDRKDDRIHQALQSLTAESQAQRADIRELRTLLLNGRRELEIQGRFGREEPLHQVLPEPRRTLREGG